MKKKITLITSGQPSINPRLVKEADALTAAGYEVVVLYQYWDEWAENADQKLLPGKNWRAICVGGSPTKNKLLYLATRVLHKISRTLHRYFGNLWILAEMASCRSCLLLCLHAKKTKSRLFIAHNLGALAPTYWASKATKGICGFDAEDFHRHERTADVNDKDVLLKKHLEEKYIPKLSYLSTASPLINEQYQQLFPKQSPFYTLNVFPLSHQRNSPDYSLKNPLKLFWFSQKIGPDRGIEDVFGALKYLDGKNIEFHLLGKPRPDIIQQFNDLIQQLNFKQLPQVIYHDPRDEISLLELTKEFDIGLALEPGFSPNNHFALSNKIFTYLNCGLGVICSSTQAQSAFMEMYPEVGSLYPIGDSKSLAKIIQYYLEQPEKLNECKAAARKLTAEPLNWEEESAKFLKVVSTILNK